MGKLQSYSKIALEVGKRWVSPKISRVNIGITSKCNQKCLTCNIWDTTPRNIELKDFKLLLSSNDLMWVTLTGGEPTMNPDFEQIVWRALEKIPLVQINTNGILGRRVEEAVKFALQGIANGLIIVSVSIFGDKAHHDMITRVPGSYDHSVATIKRLKKINNSRLKVGIAHTICEFNLNQIAHIESLAESLKIGVSYAPERHSGYYHNDQDGNGYKLTLPHPKFNLDPINLFKNAFVLHGDRKAGCVAGEYSCWVMQDMNVYPCIAAVPDRPAFNLKDAGYRLDKGYDLKAIKHCEGCWTACETYQTMIFRPNRIFKGIFK